MKKICLIGIFLLLSAVSYSQSSDVIINPFWDFYAENKLSATNAGKGNTGVASENDLSGITLNPASFEPVNKFQVIGSYEVKSSIKWYFDNNIFVKGIHPTMLAGIGYKINDKFSSGLVYSNQNNFKIDYGEIITTNEFGDITGKTDAYQRYTTNNFTIPIVYKTKKFKAGVNLTAIYYKGYTKFSESPLSSTFWKFIPTLGIIYSPLETFSFGASFSPGYQQKIEWKSDTQSFINTPNYFPAKLYAGVELKLLNKKLILDLDYHFAQTSKNYGQTDRHDLFLGGQYTVLSNLILRSGIFTSRDFRTGNYLEEVGKYTSYFITLGGTYKYKGYSFSLAFMNNDIIRSTTVSHSRLGATVSYDFDLK